MRELLGTAVVIAGSALAAWAWFVIPERARRSRRPRIRAVRELDEDWMARRAAEAGRDRKGGDGDA